MDKVFIDSNFFIALHNPNDSLHKDAVNISKTLIETSPRAYISNYVFLETVTVLSQRVSRKEAITRGAQLLSDDFNFIQVNDQLQDHSWQLFCEVSKKNTSFVDCSTIAAMQTYEINTLLTFDREDFKPLLKKFHLSLF